MIIEPSPTETSGLARRLADELGRVFGAAPGRVWVRLHTLSAENYAENQIAIQPADWPVFASVLHVRPPQGKARVAEVEAVTLAVATCVKRPPDRVHVEYSAAGSGRVAFGGKLV